MKEVKFISAHYDLSDSVQKQGNRKSIQKYLDDGYYVKEERNGNWVLVKPVRIMVTVEGKISVNMKPQILDYYGKKRASTKIFEQFYQDAEEGVIKFYLNQGQLIMR